MNASVCLLVLPSAVLVACAAGPRTPAPVVTLHVAATRARSAASVSDHATWSGEAWVTAAFAPVHPAPRVVPYVDPTPRAAPPGPRARDPRLAAWERVEVERAFARCLQLGASP